MSDSCRCMARGADAGGRDDDRPPDGNERDADADDDADARNDLEWAREAAIDAVPLILAEEYEDEVRRKSRGTGAEDENEEDEDCCCINGGGGGGDPNKNEFWELAYLSEESADDINAEAEDDDEVEDDCTRDAEIQHRFSDKWRSTTASTLSPRRVIWSTMPHTGHTQVCCRRKLVRCKQKR